MNSNSDRTRQIKAAMVGNSSNLNYVFGAQRREVLSRRADLVPEIICETCLDTDLELLQGVEVIFSTWGMPRFLCHQLDSLPDLRAVFYAAGSCQGFARPLLERGIIVTSAWRANAIPVAEFALAQILLSCKGYWRNVEEYRRPENDIVPFRGLGCYGETIALLGAGAIGQALIELLQPFHLHIIVYDPFLEPDRARRLGVERVSLEEAFSKGYVVSNHMADNDETAGLINGELLSSMRTGATFINTGRGRTVVESDLEAVMKSRTDLVALLDVTDPEPMLANSPLKSMPNVHVSGHIAGAINDEVGRMADSALAEFERYAHGEPLQHAVTLDMLSTMA